MALQSEEVRVAITGEAFVAPTATASPTTAVTPLDAAFTGLGYVNSDGVVEAYEESTSDIVAWQNGAIVRKIISQSEARLTLTLIQTNKDVLELYHKGSLVVSDGATGARLDVLSPSPDPRSFVFDVIDNDRHIRIYVERGEVMERGEITYATEDAISYNVMITCYPVDDGAGNSVVLTKFSDDPAWL